MALQMSPVDAHSENQPQCYCQPAALLPEVTAVSSSQVEPLQCQLLECSSAEQVPLPAVSFYLYFLLEECHVNIFIIQSIVFVTRVM